MAVIKVGDVEVHRVEEMLRPGFEPAFLFPDWRPEVLAEHAGWLVPDFYSPADGRFIASIHSWVIKTAHHTIVVDACSGNHKNRPAFERFHMLDTPYLERLRAAGVDPAAVDFVLCTHLHVDHVGWNTKLVDGRWVPTFPNAKYVMSRIERDFWDTRTGAGGKLPTNENVFEDSVRPILEAGLEQLVEGVHMLGDGLMIEPAPGHSPGHVVLKLASGTGRALFCGDVMHQPIQIYQPDWNSRFCVDPDAARASRRRVLEHCASHGDLLMPAHFGKPHVGHVRERGGKFSFDRSGIV